MSLKSKYVAGAAAAALLMGAFAGAHAQDKKYDIFT